MASYAGMAHADLIQNIYNFLLAYRDNLTYGADSQGNPTTISQQFSSLNSLLGGDFTSKTTQEVIQPWRVGTSYANLELAGLVGANAATHNAGNFLRLYNTKTAGFDQIAKYNFIDPTNGTSLKQKQDVYGVAGELMSLMTTGYQLEEVVYWNGVDSNGNEIIYRNVIDMSQAKQFVTTGKDMKIQTSTLNTWKKTQDAEGARALSNHRSAFTRLVAISCRGNQAVAKAAAHGRTIVNEFANVYGPKIDEAFENELQDNHSKFLAMKQEIEMGIVSVLPDVLKAEWYSEYYSSFPTEGLDGPTVWAYIKYASGNAPWYTGGDRGYTSIKGLNKLGGTMNGISNNSLNDSLSILRNIYDNMNASKDVIISDSQLMSMAQALANTLDQQNWDYKVANYADRDAQKLASACVAQLWQPGRGSSKSKSQKKARDLAKQIIQTKSKNRGKTK